MVTIDGTKYACERCIRGHRVSGCNHVDKPLTMIKKKGRPTTHCSRCRKGKGAKQGSTVTCSCSDGRRERTVITPKDLALLKQEPGVKIELANGSLLSFDTDGHDYSSNATESPMAESPTLPKRMCAVGACSPVSHTSVLTEHGYDAPPRMECRYARERAEDFTPAVVPRHPVESNEPGAYGPDDEYLNVPAFQYETGFFGQPYNADLYNSASGNNAAAAQANAGGESTAAIASVGLADDRRFGTRFDSMKNRSPGRFDPLAHHSLLSTTSQDLEASIKALSPLADPGLDRVHGSDEVVSSTELTESGGSPPANNSDAANGPAKTGSMTDQNQEPFSSIQSMPKLSSLY